MKSLPLRGREVSLSHESNPAALYIGRKKALPPNCERPQYLRQGQYLPLPRTVETDWECPTSDTCCCAEGKSIPRSYKSPPRILCFNEPGPDFPTNTTENAPPVKSGALYQNTNISVLFSVLKPILDAPLTGSASVRRPSQPLPPDRTCSGILYLKKRPAPLLESAPFLLPQRHHTPSLRLAFICFFCSYIFSSALRKTSSAL